VSYIDQLPLRTTAAWSLFKEAQVIPWRYGVVTGACVQYDEERRFFVWADHASDVISAVYVDGQIQLGYEAKNVQDSTGHPVTMIEFTKPVDEGAEVTATGRGKVSPTTGVALENPADVLADVIGVHPNAVAAFRAECEQFGFVASGEITEFVSRQTAAHAICQSFGAVFSPEMEGFARVYPGGTLQAKRHAITNDLVFGVESTTDLVSNVVVLEFDYADDKPRKALEAVAPDSLVRFGRRERRVEARWIADGRVAYSVARRALEHDARARWALSVQAVPGRVRPGDALVLEHVLLPMTGTGFAESADYDPAERLSDVRTTIPVGPVPRVELVRQSRSMGDRQYSSITIRREGADYVIELIEEDGRPIANARVILDGSTVRISDGSGIARLPAHLMTAGKHTIEIIPGGDRPSLKQEIFV
jgi:hypothetical protein